MDGHTDTPGLSDTALAAYARLWLTPLLMLLIGVAVTAFAAHIIERGAKQQAMQLFEARHQALVARLAANDRLVPGSQAFASQISAFLPEGLSVRIDTLETHTKNPAFLAETGHHQADDRTVRSEIKLAGSAWLISSTPDHRLLAAHGRVVTQTIWLAGLTISIAGALLSALLGFRWHRQVQANIELVRQEASTNRELTNAHTEKRILRQALDDSEQRSRDLVSLSGALVCEVDENGNAGYVSAQAAELLGMAPADLAGVALESLMADPDRTNFIATLDAARQERQMQRMDLTLIDASQQPVPVTLRVLALHDTLHGFSGFRLTLQPR